MAEVRSRFEGEEGGVERFLEVTKRLGFDTRQMDRTNKMFLLAEFQKSKRKPEKGVEFEAKVCKLVKRSLLFRLLLVVLVSACRSG